MWLPGCALGRGARGCPGGPFGRLRHRVNDAQKVGGRDLHDFAVGAVSWSLFVVGRLTAFDCDWDVSPWLATRPTIGHDRARPARPANKMPSFVAVQQCVDGTRRGVQAVISLRFGEIADASDVAVDREQPAAGSPLFGGVVALDGFVGRISRQEVLNPRSADDGVPGRRVVSFRAADRQHLHARFAVASTRGRLGKPADGGRPDPDQTDIDG